MLFPRLNGSITAFLIIETIAIDILLPFHPLGFIGILVYVIVLNYLLFFI